MLGERLASINITERVNQRISISGIIRDISTKAMKNGAAMMTFNIVDNELSRRITIFDLTEYISNKINGCLGQPVCVTVDVKPYDKGDDGVSLIMYDIKIDDTVSIDEFIPSVKNIKWYVDVLNEYLNMFCNTIYGKIASDLIIKYWKQFSVMPGGKSQHHDLKGGLLMHSVCVAMNCMSDAMNYNTAYGEEFVNKALLISGALIHDIGKCFELEYDGMGGCDYTARAALETHTMIGLSLIDETAKNLGYSDYDEVLELKHLVASHHGKLEWGAATRPSTVEANILCRNDEKDAVVYKYKKKTSGLKTGEYVSDWLNGASMEVYYKPMSAEDAINNLEINNMLDGESSEETTGA